MLKRLCSIVLTALLLQTFAVPAFAKSNAEKEAKRTEKVRTQLAKLGTGSDALIKVNVSASASLTKPSSFVLSRSR